MADQTRTRSRRDFLRWTTGVIAVAAAGRSLADEPSVAPSPAGGLPDAARDFRLDPELAYFNCGSLGPSPGPVIDAVKNAMDRLERNPVHFGFGPMLSEADRTRTLAADLLGCDADEIAITRNTTEGMNLVASGIDLKRGDRILTTDHEHGGGLAGWQHLARRSGVTIDQVKLPVSSNDPDRIVALFDKAIMRNTRVVSVSHVTYTTGLRLPIARITDRAHQSGCLMVVDGAQAAGGIDVNVHDLKCDAYATSGHKWLLGPKGTGLLYIRREVQPRIRPAMLERGMGVYTAATGTRDLPSILGLAAALDWSAKLGRAGIYAHIMVLRTRIETGLSDVPSVRVVSPSVDGALASGIVSIALPEHVNRYEVVSALAKRQQIVVRVMDHGPAHMRIAPHVYNTEDEVDRLVDALRYVL